MRWLLRLAFLATASWAALNLGNDAVWNARACHQPAHLESAPGQWRVGSATWQQFARTAETIARVVPQREQVAVRAPAERWMLVWFTAYLLPHHNVIPISRNPQPELAPYTVSLEQPWGHPKLRLIHESEHVWIYRQAE